MKLVQFDSAPALLLDDLPSWKPGIVATITKPAGLATSLRQQEERTPLSKTVRWEFQFTLTLDGDAARTFELLLRDYRTQPVLFPAWPMGLEWYSRQVDEYSAGAWYVSDGTRSELYTTAEPQWPTDCALRYPVLLGRLDIAPLEWQHANLAIYKAKFTEQSAVKYAVTAANPNPPLGPFPATGWPFRPVYLDMVRNHGSIKTTTEITVVRSKVGFGRQQVELARDQLSRVSTDPPSTLASRESIADLVGFFAAAGISIPFWLPGWSNALRPSKLSTTANTLILDGLPSVKVGDLVGTMNPPDFWHAKVIAVSVGTIQTSITLDSSVQALVPYLASKQPPVIAQFRLMRFNKDSLQLSWVNRLLATITTPFIEVSSEYDPGAAEKVGLSIGAMPTRAYLFDLANETSSERFTSFESAITFNANAYSPVVIDHENIKQGIQLDMDKLKIRLGLDTSGILKRLVTLRNETPIWLIVTQVDLDKDNNPLAPLILFTGEVSEASVSAGLIQATANPGGNVFERTVPRFRIKTDCNYELFSPGCVGPDGITAKVNWAFNGTMADPGPKGFPYAFKISNLKRQTGADPVFFEHWFAGGWIELGSGTTLQRRAILDSGPVQTQQVTLTLARDPDPFPKVGDAVVLYPGCDGRRETCMAYNAGTNPQGKFNNYLNFGAHPFVPIANPTLVQNKPTGVGGKK